MKKVLSLVLVIAMVLSSMSFAFAAKFDDVTGDYTKAIETLAGLGIITGYEDGTYRPEKVVTRAEMAKLMVEILGYGNLVSGAKSNFTDTQGHWADSWIAIAAGRGIVIGTGDGKFAPDRTVSYDEVLTMVVRGLGYTDNSNEIKNMPWPTNFKVKAAEIGVTNGVKMSTSGADRGGVAQALYNALKAVLVSVDNDGNVTSVKDVNDVNTLKTLITRVATPVGTKRSPLVIKPEFVDPNSREYKGDIVDLVPYMYEGVEAYASRNDEDKIVYVGESYSKTVKGTFVANNPSGTYAKNNRFDVDLEDGSTESLYIDTAKDATKSGVKVYYNGKQVVLKENELENGIVDEVVSLDVTEVAEVKVVLDKDGDVESIVAFNPTFAQKVISGYKADSLKLSRIQLPKKGDKVDLSKVTVTGAVDDIKDIKADDVVVAYAAGGADNAGVPSKVELVVVRDTIEGTVTKVNKNTDDKVTAIYVDGVKYTRSEVPGRTETFDVGYEGTFFLDNSGNLFAADATAIASAKDYAVVIEAKQGEIGSSGRTLADAELKVITAAGEVVTYKVDEDAVYQVNGKKTSNKVLDKQTTTIDFIGALVANGNTKGSTALIKIRLDGNVVDAIEVMAPEAISTGTSKPVSTDSAKFEVAKDAPIFSIKANESDYTKKEHYSVVKAENLPSSITVTYSEYTGNGEYKVIVSTDADRTMSGTFALITAADYIMDGNNKVAEIKAYVDGKEVTYLTRNEDEVTDINKGIIKELNLKSGKVDSIAAAQPENTVTGVTSTGAAITFNVKGATVTAATMTRLSIKDANNNEADFDLDADNLVVYVLKSNDKFDYVEESIKNIRGFEIVGLYEAKSSNNEIRIVVVK